MATRFYLPYTGYTPVVGTTWTSAGEGWAAGVSGMIVQNSYITPPGDAMATLQGRFTLSPTYEAVSMGRWVTPPILPGTVLSGTASVMMLVRGFRVSDGLAPSNSFAMSVHVIRNNVVRHSATGGWWAAHGLSSTALIADGTTAPLAPYTTVAGDRLVFMVGFAGGDYVDAKYEIRAGSSAASDITTLGASDDLRPYFEMSQTLTFDTSVNAATGSFTASGQNAQLTALRLPLVGDAGAVVVAGQDAAFSIGKRVAADAGSFVVAGQTSGLLATRVIVPDAGAFTLAGQASGLNHGSASQIDAGAFVVDGQDAGLVVGKGVAAGTGVFVVNGQDAALVYSGTPPVTGNGTQCDTLAWMLIDEPGGSW